MLYANITISEFCQYPEKLGGRRCRRNGGEASGANWRPSTAKHLCVDTSAGDGKPHGGRHVQPPVWAIALKPSATGQFALSMTFVDAKIRELLKVCSTIKRIVAGTSSEAACWTAERSPVKCSAIP